jgi:hypothetical protein
VAYVHQLHTLLALISDLYQYPEHVRALAVLLALTHPPPDASYAFANLDDVRSETNVPADLTDSP